MAASGAQAQKKGAGKVAKYEYKLLSRQWNVYEPQVEGAELEKEISRLAAEGWRVVSSAMTTFPAFLDQVTECLVILERPAGESER